MTKVAKTRRHRAKSVARLLSGYGVLEWRQDPPMTNNLCGTTFAVRVEGIKIRDKLSPGKVLRNLRELHPGYVPAMFRATQPDVEDCEITMYAADWIKLVVYWETKGKVRL
jgi:hypothetical protein